MLLGKDKSTSRESKQIEDKIEIIKTQVATSKNCKISHSHIIASLKL